MKQNKNLEFTEKDYDFMNSLSSAILVQSPTKVSRVIKIWLLTIFFLLSGHR
ncbi:hypothetical protein [Sulfurimonas sp.]|uniref:hypothetical protein n=1 Tax=Sulfurimonas sp. TaxID=2022749 RepID=UPI002AB04FD2|nr:hypothetical protein [Sulfurimonas sp.]